MKLDDYEVRVLINGLVQQHRSYDAETNGQIDALALRLCDIAEAMKPGRKKKIHFEPVETRVTCQCLMEPIPFKCVKNECRKRLSFDLIFSLIRDMIRNIAKGGRSYGGKLQKTVPSYD